LLRRRSAGPCLAFLALLLVSLPTRKALAQEAPPLEAEGPAQTSAHARPKAAGPVPSVAGRPALAKPASGKVPAGPPLSPKPGIAKAQIVPAKTAARGGPAVKNDGKRYLRSLDENHDARISREEFLASAKKRFAKMDLNGDGVISAQEARAAKAKLMERKAKSDARRLAQGKPVKRKAKSDRPPKPYLSSADANHDGRVSRKEYLARREKKFAELDLNRDGGISKEEAKAAKGKLLARREQRKEEAKERAVRKQAKAEARAAAQPETGAVAEAQLVPAQTGTQAVPPPAE
jgi:hypothetical protein